MTMAMQSMLEGMGISANDMLRGVLRLLISDNAAAGLFAAIGIALLI